MRKLKYVKMFENFDTNQPILLPDGTIEGIQAKPSPWGKYKRYVFAKYPEEINYVDSSVIVNGMEEFEEFAKIVGTNLHLISGLRNFIFLPGQTSHSAYPYFSFNTENNGGKECIGWVIGHNGSDKHEKPLIQFGGSHTIERKSLEVLENMILDECPIMKHKTYESEEDFQQWLSRFQRKTMTN